MSVQFDFTDKVVLITGGTSGIGKATARTFADAGATVVITARDEQRGHEALAEIGSDLVHFIPADMSEPDDIKHLFRQLIRNFGKLDYAVNNAASELGIGVPLYKAEEDEFDYVIDVNVKGVWLCMKYEILEMLKQSPAPCAIVNVSSVNGLGGAPGGALYSASKAAVIALTKSAAQEVAKQNIRVNVLVPGAYDTPMLQKAFESHTGGDPENLEAVRQMYLGFIPQGRIGDPLEAANAIVWMCSDAASYMTGHSMIVDGGMSAMLR